MILSAKIGATLIGVGVVFLAAVDTAADGWEKLLGIGYPVVAGAATAATAFYVRARRDGRKEGTRDELLRQMEASQTKFATKDDVAAVHREVAACRDDIRMLTDKLIPDAK